MLRGVEFTSSPWPLDLGWMRRNWRALLVIRTVRIKLMWRALTVCRWSRPEWSTSSATVSAPWITLCVCEQLKQALIQQQYICILYQWPWRKYLAVITEWNVFLSSMTNEQWARSVQRSIYEHDGFITQKIPSDSQNSSLFMRGW